MYGLIIAGGSGTRLWPFSRGNHPKQLLTLLGGTQSLMQDTFARLAGSVPPGQIYTVTGLPYRHQVLGQLRALAPDLPDDNVLCEPYGRDSAPAVLLGALRIAQRDPDAVVATVWSDQVIRNVSAFRDALQRAEGLVAKGGLLAIGVTPTRPETGLGYIKFGAELGQGVYRVERFEEKPDLQHAQRYVASGNYAWNAGIFVFHAATLIGEYERLAPLMMRRFHEFQVPLQASNWSDEALLNQVYSKLQRESIDYLILERTDKLSVMPCDLDWSDLGAWDIVYQESPKNAEGNVVAGNVVTLETRNSLVRAGERLVTLVGMENVVVVDTEDALLICDMARVQDVKLLVDILKVQGKPEVQEARWSVRPWGRFHVLAEAKGYKLKLIEVSPGGKLSLQLHHHRAEHWVVIEGEIQVVLDESLRTLGVNDYIHIPVRAKHRIANAGTSSASLIELQVGHYLGEDDITRFEDIYGRS
ncbi:MAG: mannose-1-phosphate guanylyltransferase/mannose-6-phosphate isomerase [Candidatus Lambdaproteobacteria bacterium]|nr:mannose-1-phosphate guanylyltransferase/mannose-6-phosphate isomerase [Candidatus Lambdaproteobacteria bacterium]